MSRILDFITFVVWLSSSAHSSFGVFTNLSVYTSKTRSTPRFTSVTGRSVIAAKISGSLYIQANNILLSKSRNVDLNRAKTRMQTNIGSQTYFRENEAYFSHPNSTTDCSYQNTSTMNEDLGYRAKRRLATKNVVTRKVGKTMSRAIKRELHDNAAIQNQAGHEATFGRSKQKNRRFLSNLKKKLKETIKKAESWKLSRKEAKKLFDKYNKCLMAKVKEILKEDFPIEAFMAIEGEKVSFNCSVCYRPDVDKESQKAKWQVLRHEDTALKAIRSKGKFKITKENTLIIKDIDVNDAGQYFCVEQHDYAAIYQLDVFLTDRRKHLKQGLDKPLGENLLINRNLRVFTMWASWGECNTCGKEGHKLRVGQCTVQKIYSDAPVFPRDYPLMALYPEGIPCHSTALPRHIRKLGEIGLRYSETLVSPCQQPCPTEPAAKIITDEDGKVLEVVEPGYHSMKNKPKLPPLVKRKVLYEQEKSHLVLHCPGDLDASLIRWAKGKREVDPASIKRQTQGRVWVDSLTRLHLKTLMLSDTGVYNCWVKTRHVASMKVIVVDESNQNIKHYISYAGLAITLIGSFLFVFCICCKKSDKSAQ